MSITAQLKLQLISEYATAENNTGSCSIDVVRYNLISGNIPGLLMCAGQHRNRVLKSVKRKHVPESRVANIDQGGGMFRLDRLEQCQAHWEMRQGRYQQQRRHLNPTPERHTRK